MPTAADLVKQALRENNLIPISEEPTVDQAAEGLTLLNRFLDSLFGYELGEFVTSWSVRPSSTSPVPAQYPLLPRNQDLPDDVWPYPPDNSNILMNIGSNTTIYLPVSPCDGAITLFTNVGGVQASTLTVDGNGRLIKGLATLADTPENLNGQRLLYRADMGDWVLVSNLAAIDASPLPAMYDDLLALGTAVRIAPRYGRSIPIETASTLRRLIQRMRAQYKQKVQEPNASPQPFMGGDGDGAWLGSNTN